MRALCFVALLAACYSPSAGDCSYTCANKACPSGLTCRDGFCREPDKSGTCGGGDATPACPVCAASEPCFEGVCGGAVVKDIAAGEAFACALLTSGSVWCWGANDWKQLGNSADVLTCDDKPCRYAPRKVMGLAMKATKITAGMHNVCAVLADKTVSCWGRSELGALGRDPTGDESCATKPCTGTPKPIAGLTNVDEVVLGMLSGCARVGSNAVCWGLNNHGNIGDGTTTALNPKLEPTAVIISDVAKLATTAFFDVHVCAVKAKGTVACWGNNLYGSTAQPNNTPACPSNYACTPTPADVSGASSVTDILAAGHVTCASTTTGMLCWGLCSNGITGGAACQTVGDGHTMLAAPTVFTSTPAGGFVSIAGRVSHACAIEAKGVGAIWCWGTQTRGELGDGIVVGPENCGPSSQPCRKTAAKTVPEIKGRVFPGAGPFTLAIDDQNVPWGWGANKYGQAGHPPLLSVDQSCTDGPCNPTPLQIEGLPAGM